MKKYIVNESRYNETYHAGCKAPTDIYNILRNNGFIPVSTNYLSMQRWYRIFILPLILPLILLKLFLSIRNNSILIFQHPYDTQHSTIRTIYSIVLHIKKGIKTIAIVHDINNLRYNKPSESNDIPILFQYDCLIVHSYRMKDFIAEHNYSGECKVLGLFDYLISKPYEGTRQYSQDVVFAGNLEKSIFLYNIKKEMDVGRLFLYGNKPSKNMNSTSLIYKGRFSPDDLSQIEGSWGLVWDGDSTTCLSGTLGEYLRFNSPHKASLYICAHLPLIVPSDSAIAGIVAEHKIGITISSLDEIKKAIDNVSESDYAEMQQNLKEYSQKLLSGKNILSSLNSVS